MTEFPKLARDSSRAYSKNTHSTSAAATTWEEVLCFMHAGPRGEGSPFNRHDLRGLDKSTGHYNVQN